jgi:hypothetical protein
MKIRSAPLLPTGRVGRMLALGITLVLPLVLWEGVAAPLIARYAKRATVLVERRELASHMERLAAAIPELQRRANHVHNGQDAALLLNGDTDAIAAAALQEKGRPWPPPRVPRCRASKHCRRSNSATIAASVSESQSTPEPGRS